MDAARDQARREAGMDERTNEKAPPDFSGGAFVNCVGGFLGFCVLGRPGSVLLSRGLSRSTMDAEGFDGRVRNGIG